MASYLVLILAFSASLGRNLLELSSVLFGTKLTFGTLQHIKNIFHNYCTYRMNFGSFKAVFGAGQTIPLGLCF